MSFRHVVVDGSNIATEGRSLPSLSQLDAAVRALLDEFPGTDITVVVDATFGHRIPEEDRVAFEEARDHGELVSPPAGAIGRGDAFLLRIAEKTGATVLSNDSFQEFHGEHEWLFSPGRLLGAVPVPGVGWIFTPRTPVRGPKSREAVRDAKRSRARIGSKEASQPMPVPKTPPPGRPPKGGRPPTGGPVEEAAPKARAGKAAKAAKAVKGGHRAEETMEEAIAEATEEAVRPGGGSRRRRRRRGSGVAAEPVNAPLAFINFVADHHLASEVEGVVDSFTSHGAFVLVGDTRCYVPLSALGDPAPRSAREVLRKGETRSFVIQAFDAQRRGVELALPGHVRVAGGPTEETVEAEIEEQPLPIEAPSPRARAAAKRATNKAASAAPARKAAGSRKKAAPEVDVAAAAAAPSPVPVASTEVREPAPAKKAAVKKAAAKTAVVKKTAVKKAAPTPTKKAVAKKGAAPAKKAAGSAKKTTAKKAPAKKAPATPTTTKKAPAKKAAPAAAKKAAPAAAKKAVTKKAAAPAKKATGSAKKAATPAKKAAGG